MKRSLNHIFLLKLSKYITFSMTKEGQIFYKLKSITFIWVLNGLCINFCSNVLLHWILTKVNLKFVNQHISKFSLYLTQLTISQLTYFYNETNNSHDCLKSCTRFFLTPCLRHFQNCVYQFKSRVNHFQTIFNFQQTKIFSHSWHWRAVFNNHRHLRTDKLFSPPPFSQTNS